MKKLNRYSVEYEYMGIISYEAVSAMTSEEAKQRVQQSKTMAIIRSVILLGDSEIKS